MPSLRHLPAILLVAAAVFAGPLHAQTMTPQQIQQLVDDSVYNELKHGTIEASFYLRKKDRKGDTTKLIVETKDGDVARLVQKNGQPLSVEDDQAEIARLKDLLAHPEAQERRHKREQEDSQHGNVVIEYLGKAFDYTYAGEEPSPHGELVKLSFVPKPSFQPPNLEAGVLKGLAGTLTIDQRQKRIVKLDAHLISDVNFGWGILGKLYKGGTIYVEQSDVVPTHWETALLKLNLHGKEVMMVAINEETEERSWGFERRPDNWTYQDAVNWLLSKSNAEWQPK